MSTKGMSVLSNFYEPRPFKYSKHYFGRYILQKNMIDKPLYENSYIDTDSYIDLWGISTLFTNEFDKFSPSPSFKIYKRVHINTPFYMKLVKVLDDYWSMEGDRSVLYSRLDYFWDYKKSKSSLSNITKFIGEWNENE